MYQESLKLVLRVNEKRAQREYQECFKYILRTYVLKKFEGCFMED